MTTEQNSNIDRRHSVRIKKNYIIRFIDKHNPAIEYAISQIENISKGGLCFTSTVELLPGTELIIELRTPYIADTIFLEGQILDCHERVKGMIFANRICFKNITPQAKDILDKIEKFNINKPGTK